MHEAYVLSTRQRQILQMIRDFSAEYGYPPTIRQIGKVVGISSTSVVSYNLGVLQRRGLLNRDQDVSRGLRLVEEGASIISVPMMGRIGAGLPKVQLDVGLTAQEAEPVLIPADLVRSSERIYALEVSGTSMIDALVGDGDTVIVRQQAEARNGDMVAAWIISQKATTLKRFHWEKERNLVRLEPANPLMEPIYVDPSDLEIQGRVVAVLRRLE